MEIKAPTHATLDPDYLPTLQLYYEEEIEGEAYFAELARAFDVPDHRTKLDLLARVERHAAQAVEPLLDKYGLTPRAGSDLRDSGARSARATPPDWAALLAGMNRDYPGYLDSFHKLEQMAPAEDRVRLNFLTEHEVAALCFLALEDLAPGRSRAPLEAYLKARPESWTVKPS